MQTIIALLRGINVGGHNKLPMAELRALCESIGLREPKTYIQSGNIVFESDKNAEEIANNIEVAIEKRFGFRPPVLVIKAEELVAAAENYPFPTDDHKCSHLMFLDAQPADPAIEKLPDLNQGTDKVSMGRRVVYFFLPNGVSGAKIDGAKIEKTLGVHCTTRNWRTVQKLIEMSSR